MSRRDVEAPETLESLGSFKVSASVSEAATSHLDLVRDSKCLISVSSQKKFEHLGLVSVSETWVSGLVSAQKVLCTLLQDCDVTYGQIFTKFRAYLPSVIKN